jgi:hypothetical protein
MRTLRTSQVSLPRSAGGTAFDTPPPRDGRLSTTETPVRLRLRIYLMRGRIDRGIAAGRDCGSTDELTLRARQLTDPGTRRELARSLRRVVDYADRETSRSLITSVMVEPTAVKYGRAALLDLADQLELAHRVSPRGVVLVRGLLSDGVSPLYNPHSERTVTEVAREIQDALVLRPASEALAA